MSPRDCGGNANRKPRREGDIVLHRDANESRARRATRKTVGIGHDRMAKFIPDISAEWRSWKYSPERSIGVQLMKATHCSGAGGMPIARRQARPGVPQWVGPVTGGGLPPWLVAIFLQETSNVQQQSCL